MSLLRQRFVAALLGAILVWRTVNGVGALVRWLWLGERLGNVSMLVFLVTVFVGPVIGALGGDAALRNGIWSGACRAEARRLESIIALAVLPLGSNLLLNTLSPAQELLLPLRGGVTLALVAAVIVVERQAGPLILGSGGDE